MAEYIPIPVEAARDIAQRYAKHIIAIVAWDRAHALTHVTTYGATAPDKIGAAKLGEILTKAALGDVGKLGQTHEDFRLRTAAEWAEERERLRTACTAADHLISSLLAVREGATDELLTDVQNNIRAALVPPPPARSIYPPDWPKCPGCGQPALDGHITCGNVACNEGGRRP